MSTTDPERPPCPRSATPKGACPNAAASNGAASQEGFDRRTLLLGGGLAAAGVAAAGVMRQHWLPRASVFVARNQRYDGPLTDSIRDGLRASGVDPSALAGKKVLLKPNLVEPRRDVPHMTTHPAMILAAADVFRGWGAEVAVGEGPGHVRDSELALLDSGVYDALEVGELSFCDLNYEQVTWVRNRGRASDLRGFYLPQSVAEADLIVSLPKMKTHHWVGFTCSMKNFYGVLPGIKYGWPKNVLHYNGIPQTVYDINASLPPSLAIVDGIDCMEGDGPILGSLKQMGLILVGSNLPAVDATAARIMGLDPTRVSYLKLAADRLGPLAEARIEQRGERWEQVADPFQILDQPHLRSLQVAGGPLVS